MVDRVGQRLGNYQLIRLLGRGGFAEVYIGEHLLLHTQAAVKILYARIATPGEVEAFEKEARTIAHLSHPHIVRVLDFHVQDDTPFLVMDYAVGGTLRQRHPRGTILPLPVIISYIKQIADALQYAHDHRLIHRDVKPENMLLGKRDEVLLSDFGIAAVAHHTSSQSTQAVAGTVPYMAPEQIQGKPQPASDQYALGIVLYEWLSGSLPFNGTAAEIAMQHVLAPIPSLRANGLTISPEVEQVVMTSLAKDPKQRFGSVQEFATALEQASLGRVKVVGRSSTKPAPVPEPPVQRAAVDAARSEEWAMFGYDPQHTHYNPNEQLISPDNVNRLFVAWSASLGGMVSHSSPAVANGLVYVGSWGKKFYAFDAATGQERWSASIGGGFLSSIDSSPAVANGLVYIGSNKDKFYALDATTGQERWSIKMHSVTYCSPAIADGLVYVDSWYGLYALNATTGQERWSTSTEGLINHCSPAVADGLVYVGSEGGHLYAFDAKNGNIRWSDSPNYRDYRKIQHCSPAVANGLVYIGCDDHNLYAFDAKTGKRRWIASTGGYIHSSPAVANGLVYVGSDDHNLYAFDAKTGKRRWTASTWGNIQSSPTVANGLVYVGSDDRRLYAFDAATGKLCRYIDTQGLINSSPAVANGLVYVGSFDDKLYAFRLE